MAKKQTRRGVSLSKEDFELLQRIAKRKKRPMSQVVQSFLHEYAEKAGYYVPKVKQELAENRLVYATKTVLPVTEIEGEDPRDTEIEIDFVPVKEYAFNIETVPRIADIKSSIIRTARRLSTAQEIFANIPPYYRPSFAVVEIIIKALLEDDKISAINQRMYTSLPAKKEK